MSTITSRLGAMKGAKYRPVHWHDLYRPDKGVIGWGIEEKQAGRRRYVPVGWKGQVHPFSSKAEAAELCAHLNAEAQL